MTTPTESQQTPIDWLLDLAQSDARIEWGILYSATPGGDGRRRYPRLGWIQEATNELSGRCAIHVCGRQGFRNFLDGVLAMAMKGCPRIQINGTHYPSEIASICNAHKPHAIITQDNTRQRRGMEDITPENHQILVDSSGGRGISACEWIRPVTTKRVGFAGGLSARFGLISKAHCATKRIVSLDKKSSGSWSG